MSQYFPKPYESFRWDIDVKVDWSNYAAKADLNNATGIYISELALRSDLPNLKAEVGKIDVYKWKTISVDLSKLSNAVNNDVVKKAVHDKSAARVNNIDISGFVLKTYYDPDKSELEMKIPDTSGLKKQTIMLKLLT